MREILFRGKRIDNGEWVEGGIYYQKSDDVKEEAIYIIGSSLNDVGCAYEVIPETVGQYTGLTDKNGKKIFEGDIIRYADLYDYNCYLESLDNIEAYDKWDFGDIWTIDKVGYYAENDYPAFDLCKHDFDSNGLSELVGSMQYHYEVIANIYDNPELLKGVI